MSKLSVSSIVQARAALAALAPNDALSHLETATRSLQHLAAALQGGASLAPAEKRDLERLLLQFRNELRAAAALADRGLAYCQDWAYNLQPPPAYQANGAAAGASADHHNLSIEA